MRYCEASLYFCNMNWIGDRISYIDHETKTTIIVTPEQVGSAKALIGAWFFMWTAIGATLIWYFFSMKPTQQEQIIIVVFMAFWVYYFFRIGRMFFWLLWGKEYLKIDKIGLTIKTSIKDYGKANQYFIENIKKVKVQMPESKSLQSAWENSPWIRGGERIEFEYMGKNIRFGRKLKEQEAKQLFQLITKRIDDHLKKNRKSVAAD